ncbi:MAG TPA: LamG domain-containing protein [Sedimentisphaerales bacterium]|nr:LamG domain-containing protein [Sedimentisphaerales bacterium]
MKRVLILVLAAQVALFVGGCEKKSGGPSGPGDVEGGAEPAVREREAFSPPVVVEEEEVVEPDPNRGLAGWWKLDEDSGTTAADSSGNGRDGTLMGNVSFDNNSVEGQVGNALRLEGKGVYIQITGYKGVTGTAPRTVAAWIKTEHDNGQILSWGREEGGAMFNFGFVPGRRRVGVTPEGGYLYMKDSTTDNKWHHVAAVVEEAALPNLYDNVKLFLDGDAAVIHDIGVLDLYPIQTGSDLDVSVGKGFSGALDDVRLYDRALTEKEIELLYKSTKK